MGQHRSLHERVELVEDWRRSGLSGAEFCRRRNLPVDSLYKWRRRIARLEPETECRSDVNGEAAGSFVPIRFHPDEVTCGVSVLVGTVRLELASGFSQKELVRAVTALREVGEC